KMETARATATYPLQQKERFDAVKEEFNHQRPHEALNQKRPGDFYKPSTRPFWPNPPEPDDDVLWVSSSGHVTLGRSERYHIANALTGQPLGIRECPDGRWLVTFASIDLGYLDRRTKTFDQMNPQSVK